MTDLQVKYQQLQHDKAVLEEERRLHDAQIAKAQAEASTSLKQGEKLSAEAQKILAEYQVTLKDLQYYDTDKYYQYHKTSSDIFKNISSGIGDTLKGIGSIIH